MNYAFLHILPCACYPRPQVLSMKIQANEALIALCSRGCLAQENNVTTPHKSGAMLLRSRQIHFYHLSPSIFPWLRRVIANKIRRNLSTIKPGRRVVNLSRREFQSRPSKFAVVRRVNGKWTFRDNVGWDGKGKRKSSIWKIVENGEKCINE